MRTLSALAGAALPLAVACEEAADTGPGPVADTGGPPCAEVEMIRFPGGTFTMGTPPGEEGREVEETQHSVTLTHDFEIGATEVTQDQFEACLRARPSFHGDCPDCPVDSVSWSESAAFANAMSEAAGLGRCYDCTGSGADIACDGRGDPYACEGYRLPTEAEWERAARGGLEEEAFPGGGGLVPGTGSECAGTFALDNGDLLDDQAWYCGNAEGDPHPVAGLDPNGSGLYDASGNIREACHDWYDDYPGDGTDPWGPASGWYRVYRGGSFRDSPMHLRVGRRDWDASSSYLDDQGLRLARTVP